MNWAIRVIPKVTGKTKIKQVSQPSQLSSVVLDDDIGHKNEQETVFLLYGVQLYLLLISVLFEV